MIPPPAVNAVSLVNLLHRIRVSPRPRLMTRVPLLRSLMRIKHPRRRNIIALPLRLSLRLLSLLQLRGPARNHILLGPIPQLMPQTHSDAPMRHRAPRVLLAGLSESLLRLLIPEGMQQRDPLLKSLLRL